MNIEEYFESSGKLICVIGIILTVFALILQDTYTQLLGMIVAIVGLLGIMKSKIKRLERKLNVTK